MSATHFQAGNPDPTDAAACGVRSGHICRCTGYYSIVAAIPDAARSVREA